MSADNDAFSEGARIMTICNACRYCEGYCAVFPAMERRLTFDESELAYLANLCHDCGSCFPACQYAPPHEFAVDVPRTFAQIRKETYGRFAWPPAASAAFSDPARFASAAGLIGVILFAAATLLFGAMSTATMTVVFLIAGAYVVAMLAAGIRRCWRAFGDVPLSWNELGAAAAGLRDALLLRNLEGGDNPVSTRPIFHHLAFYGFAACFAATVVAAFDDHILGWPPPYPLWSAPVALGTVGGITLLAGAAGLLRTAVDLPFIVMLLLVAFTGLLLLALRATTLMPALLAVHLGVVLGLFVTMPYGKFVHGFYRYAALLRDAIEKRRAGQV